MIEPEISSALMPVAEPFVLMPVAEPFDLDLVVVI